MDTKDRPKILDWYGELSVRRVDLVGDYAGSELFLVHGESLLLKCFEEPGLDFQDGFQLLHAVYLVERLLSSLKERKCNFHIVFFESARDLCVPPEASIHNRSKYLLTRSVVIRHLEQNLRPVPNQDVRVKRFDELLGSPFREYFSSSGAYFIMFHDGATLNDLSKMSSTVESSKQTQAERDNNEVRRKSRLRAMISDMLNEGSNVALINGMSFHDTKVMIDVLEGSRQAKYEPGGWVQPLWDDANTSSTKAGAPSTTPTELNSLMLALTETSAKCSCGTSGNDRSQMSSRRLLSVLALKEIVATHAPATKLVDAYIGHVAALEILPLSARRMKAVSSSHADLTSASQFLSALCLELSSLLDDDALNRMICQGITSDIADLLDGRLFNAVCTDSVGDAFAGQALKQRFDHLAWALCKTTGKHPTKVTSNSPQCAEAKDPRSVTKPRQNGLQSTSKASHSVLPFSNQIFDRHLLPIKIETGREQAQSVETGRIFQEITHWHNAKRPLSHKTVEPVKPWVKKRLDRKHQRYMSDMQKYAASLTNASGGLLDPEIIIVDKQLKSSSSSRPKELQNDTATTTKAKNQGKAPKKGKKQTQLDTIAASNASRQDEQAKKISSAWGTFREGLEKELDLIEKYKKVLEHYSRLSAGKREVIGAEVQYHLICILTEISLKTDSAQVSLGLRALLWDALRRVIGDNSMNAEIAARLRPIVDYLDLPEIEIPMPEATKKLVFDPKLIISASKKQQSEVKGQAFQLLHCGPYFDRNLNSAPDPRVAFEPDGWQRYVLDELDARHSLFVVAPTSAGKTFISFHAMKNVLREGDDGILVYVAPTKALVLQVAAEVQARFSKSYKYGGKCVWAVHTRDYRVNNPQGCQILVTVPQILQILLLSPSNAKAWSPRIRYIIFDEIHSIGQAEDGVVWEQLLLLAPSPIIALSATVGNPETFSGWLADTQNALGNQLVTVQHHHRFNDLRKFVFNPPRNHQFQGLKKTESFGLLGLDGLDGFSFLHPIASLVNRSRGMPPDLSLEARDCLTLYEAMKKHQTDNYPVASNLSPEQSLPSKIIRKIDIVGWERDLKALLQNWMSEADSPFDKVVEELGPTGDEMTNAMSRTSIKDQVDQRLDSSGPDETAMPHSDNQRGQQIDCNDLYQTTLPLLCKLHDRNALPAILFNYDRAACERLCRVVTSQLEEAEQEYKTTSDSWKRKVQNYEKRKATSLAKASVQKGAKKVGKSTKQTDTDGKLDRELASMESESDLFDAFDPEAPVEGFHFANNKLLSDSDLSEYLETLTWMGLSSWLNAGLRRGIGVHHAGMNRKYRQIVEILFRKGYLRVVIATGTLALGINMPCVTVVFSGDSVYLTALNYRQAAGRAGRRGFDLLGNVVFQGVSKEKACRLLSSRLPDLNGHFPVTTTLILRLFSLLHECDSPFARRAIDALLSQPRLYLNGPSFKDQVLHHLRFSIEYLRRQSLLSSKGVPINFAGLTSHLYYTENSSFAFNALVKGGYFHGLCADLKTHESQVLRTMMRVLSNIFCRRACREADTEYKEKVKNSSSIVFLEELPDEAAAILRLHNQETRQVFTNYVDTFVSQHLAKTKDSTLPLTGVEVGGDEKGTQLPSSLPPTKIRSAFVALSGHGDETIASISELCNTVRQGVFLEEAVIPYIQIYPEESGTPLNAYLYDFYMHGDTTALEKANHIRKSDVWYYLNDFSMILATIVASLANFLKISESDISQEELMGDGDLDDERREEQENDGGKPGEEQEQAVPNVQGEKDTNVARVEPTHTQAGKGKKGEVLDSWDADMSDDEDDDSGKEDDWATSINANTTLDDNRSKDDLEKGFLNIYRAFVKLQQEFNTKYRKIFA